MTRTALYVRVSTKEQTTDSQERELRRWAERLGLKVVAVYADTMSGARSDRAALAKLLTAAHRREFDVLQVWALDRVSREGIGRMVGYVEQLRAAGIRVLSQQEPWLDTDGPVGELVLAIFAWVAKQPNRSGSGSGSACAPAKLALERRASTSDVVHGSLTSKKFDGAVWLGRGGDASQKH